MQCDHSQCSNEIDGIGHSSIAVLQKVTPEEYSFFQCEQGQDYNFSNWQHFCCSHEHMQAVFSDCVQNHYSEETLHPIPLGQGVTLLHKIVLGSHLNCKLCEKPLTDVAYRFCITRATPNSAVPDNSLNDLGEWCCSLDHARQSAAATIQMFKE